MAKKKLKKSKKTLILGGIGKYIGLALATVSIMASFVVISTIFPLAIGLLVGGLVLGTASIAFGVDMEEKSNREQEQEALSKSKKNYTIEDFDLTKQAEKDNVNVETNQQSTQIVENQKEEENSDELVLTK